MKVSLKYKNKKNKYLATAHLLCHCEEHQRRSHASGRSAKGGQSLAPVPAIKCENNYWFVFIALRLSAFGGSAIGTTSLMLAMTDF